MTGERSATTRAGRARAGRPRAGRASTASRRRSSSGCRASSAATPTLTELGITSALWSEHCSYKSSKIYLREFPTSGPRVLQGPGENAGVVDIGHGWVAVFKMESHNHPSFIEPFQGAATGVGGILRDIFTMGARPIACMDSLSLRRDRRAAHALAGRRRGARHRRLRQLRRHPDGRRRDRASTPSLQRQHPGQRLRARRRAPRAHLQGQGERASATRSSTSAAHRPRRHPRRLDGVGVVRRREREEEADGAGRRPVHREDPARGLPRGDALDRDRRDPGHGRRRPDQLDLRDGGARRRRLRARPRPACRCASPGSRPTR